MILLKKVNYKMKLGPMFAREILVETSLSRIWKHITGGNTFAIISPTHHSLDSDANKNNYNKMSSELQKYGFIRLKGGYTHMDGHTVEENSFFVPNISLEEALKLGKKYGQESILFKDKNRFDLIECDSGKVLMSFIKTPTKAFTFNTDVIKNAFSKLVQSNKDKGIPFAFVPMESLSMIIPFNTSEKLVEQHKGGTRWYHEIPLEDRGEIE